MEFVNQLVPAGVPGGSTRVIDHGGLTSSQTGVLHVPGTPNVMPTGGGGPLVTVPLQSTWIFFAAPSSVILMPSLPPVINQHCAAELKPLLESGEPFSVTDETICGL